MREHGQPQNKDVEASQAELLMLESQKNAIQNDVLAIADDKKRLERERDEKIDSIEKELAQKRADAAEAIRLLDAGVISAKERKAQAERDLMSTVSGNVKKDLEKAITERDAAMEQRDAEQTKLAQARELRVAEEAKVKELSESKATIALDIDIAQKRRTDIFEENKKLEADLPAKRIEFKQLTQDCEKEGEHVKKLAELNLEADATLKAKDADIEKKNASLVELSTKIAALGNDVADLEKHIAARKESADKTDAESTTRAGNAAKLEQHVDDKLAHLKELESQFTTERLARAGYRKTS